MNVDQQGELSEALAEFSHCRRSSFRHREPAQRARHWGVFLCLLSFAQAKKVRRRQGPQPLHPLILIDDLPVAPGRRPTFLARPRKVGKRRPPSVCPPERCALWRVPSRHAINPAKKKTRLTPQTGFLRLSRLISFCSAALKGREKQNEMQ